MLRAWECIPSPDRASVPLFPTPIALHVQQHQRIPCEFSHTESDLFHFSWKEITT
jgi:hypothetical protein